MVQAGSSVSWESKSSRRRAASVDVGISRVADPEEFFPLLHGAVHSSGPARVHVLEHGEGSCGRTPVSGRAPMTAAPRTAIL